MEAGAEALRQVDQGRAIKVTQEAMGHLATQSEVVLEAVALVRLEQTRPLMREATAAMVLHRQ